MLVGKISRLKIFQTVQEAKQKFWDRCHLFSNRTNGAGTDENMQVDDPLCYEGTKNHLANSQINTSSPESRHSE